MKSWIAGLLFAVVSGSAAPAQELSVAAAADLQPVLPVLAATYEKKTGVKLKVSYSSSSVLATQIVNGAPFDVFFAADAGFPQQVVAAGLAVEPAPVPYAQGTLVLWARKDSPLGPPTLEQLTLARVTRIAVADQIHAPYGAAAYAALRSLKLLDALTPKLVVAENIAQTAQFVLTGNAQVGFISMTGAMSPQMRNVGTFVVVPKLYPPIRQCAVVMKNSAKKDAALAFLEWVRSPEVQGRLKEFGLGAVDAAK